MKNAKSTRTMKPTGTMKPTRRPRARAAQAAVALVALALALPLAGCSGGATSGTLTGTSAGATAGAVDTADSTPAAQELTVFAAASLSDTFEQQARAFETAHPGVTVRSSYDGSSTLVAQLTEGAKADVIATADHKNMDKLGDAGLLAGDPVDFASNVLVLAVPKGNPGHVQSVADLASNNLQVSVCAVGVPCGTLADQALKDANVELKGASEEQNVSAVAAKLASGEVDAGFVYATDVAASDGAIEQVLEPDGMATDYPIAVVKDAPQADLAQQYIDFVTSDEGAKILTEAGFTKP